MKQQGKQKYLILILFLLYFVVGISLYKDYGVSTDEPDERESIPFKMAQSVRNSNGYDIHVRDGQAY